VFIMESFQKVFLQMFNCFFPYIPRIDTCTWWCKNLKVLFKCTRKMINLHTIWFFGTCLEILTYTSTNPCLSIVLSLTICPQLMVCIIYFLFTTFLHTQMHSNNSHHNIKKLTIVWRLVSNMDRLGLHGCQSSRSNCFHTHLNELNLT
jgi:hypothetical protein